MPDQKGLLPVVLLCNQERNIIHENILPTAFSGACFWMVFGKFEIYDGRRFIYKIPDRFVFIYFA